MAFLSLLSVLVAGLLLFILGLFLLTLYLCVFVILPGYIIYGVIKLIMWIIEKCKGNVEHKDRIQSKLNLSFLEQKYKQMVNESISIEDFNKYLKNEIHIHYNDDYSYCKHIFEAKIDSINNESSNRSISAWHILIAVLAALLCTNWFGLHLTLLFVAVGIFVFYLLYTISIKHQEDNSGIRYSLYKHIIKFCDEKKRQSSDDVIIDMTSEMKEEKEAQEQVQTKPCSRDVENKINDDVPLQTKKEIQDSNCEDLELNEKTSNISVEDIKENDEK